jgi:hypothetical protein
VQEGEGGREERRGGGGMIGRVGDEGPKRSSALLVAHALAGFAGPHPSE